jgi:hypothetical protein
VIRAPAPRPTIEVCIGSFALAGAPFIKPNLHDTDPRNIQSNSHACQQQCQKLPQCRYGVYIKGGDRRGECWLSGHSSAAPRPCGIPCDSFAKHWLKSPAGETGCP